MNGTAISTGTHLLQAGCFQPGIGRNQSTGKEGQRAPGHAAWVQIRRETSHQSLLRVGLLWWRARRSLPRSMLAVSSITAPQHGAGAKPDDVTETIATLISVFSVSHSVSPMYDILQSHLCMHDYKYVLPPCTPSGA